MEILEAFPPTKVSSIAFSTKKRMIPLYAAYKENSKDVMEEITKENFGEILSFKLIKLYLLEKFLRLSKSALISPLAL